MARVSLKSQLEQAQEEIKLLKATLEKLLQNTPQPEPNTPPQSELRIQPQPEPNTPPQSEPSARIQGYQVDKEQRIKTLDQARIAWRTVDQEHRTRYLQSLGKKFLTNDDLLYFFSTIYPTLNPTLTQS